MVTKITDYSTTAGSNTDVAGISLAEGWAPSTVNNLLRALIAQMAGAAQSEGGWLELQTSITAGTTQTIAGAYALTSPLSHVTTCANASDGVALPANVAETQITIVNGGAYDLKIWPNNGASDTINGGSADAADANLLAAGDSRTYTAINGTNWVSHGVAVSVADNESAYSGVLQANANFVDQCLLGPSVDGRPWNGLWEKAGVFSSLMLATIEDEGSNTEINIWDLTEQTSGAISTTPLATVDLSAAATPTSIAASMGYLIVGSEDGIAIIDPHSGAWAERTVGWPRTLSTSTVPALTNNDVAYVAAGIAPASPLDPRTGGPMPSFAVAYGTGADVSGLIKYDGNVHNKSGTIESSGQSVAIYPQGYIANTFDTGDRVDVSNTPISEITADDWGANQSMSAVVGPNGFGATNGMNVSGDLMVGAHANGLTFSRGAVRSGGATGVEYATAMVNRTYNTGYMVGDIRGAWLANSATADRSYKSNTLTEEGTVTEGVVESSAELNGYSGFSSSVTLTRASDADWDVITTGSAYLSCWFKCTGNSSFEHYIGFNNSGGTIEFELGLLGAGTVRGKDDGATAQTTVTSTQTFDNSVWHKADFVRVSSTERYLYVDGILVASDTTDAGSLSSSGNLPLGIGCNGDATNNPATTSTLSLARLSTTAPNATQIRQMYDAEKGMFVASAECLLQSGSTDAVLDVDVDPLSGKVLVTQTDAITVFDGLVVDSKPTVNSGASEKGKLWGALRAEQNSANAYVTAPATDQRQVNEMVRGLASELRAGVDFSKAKAWINFVGAGTSIQSSYNIKSLTDTGTGDFVINFAIPFKDTTYTAIGQTSGGGVTSDFAYSTAAADKQPSFIVMETFNTNTFAKADGNGCYAAFFGELENE